MHQNEIKQLTTQAMQFFQGGQPDKAIDLYKKICALEPNSSDNWLMAAAISGETGRIEDAIEYLKKAIQIEPDFAEAHFTFATLLQNEEKHKEALQEINLAIQADQDYPEAWLLKCGLEGYLGLYSEAIESGHKTLLQWPECVDAYINLGNAYDALGQNEKAIEQFHCVLSSNKNHTNANISMAESLINLGQLEAAQQYLQNTEQATPGNISLLRTKARLLQRQGFNHEAFDILEPMIHQGSMDASAAVTLSRACSKLKKCDIAISAIEKLLSGSQHLTPNSVWKLEMEIGRLYDTIKQYDSAFLHFQKGHEPMQGAFNPEIWQQKIHAIKTFFSKENLATLPRSTMNTSLPVFIVGMPRSGTTLIEQILSSHPDIYGAGELTYIEKIANKLTLPRANTYEGLTDPGTSNVQDMNNAAQKYLDYITNLSGSDAKRITDKLPGNYLYIGIISLLFPNARIIHCARNPLDTCLSCYSQNFRGHEYTHSLTDLGNVYRSYQELMTHWQEVLPGQIMTVQYEDVIRATEDWSIRLIEFCGMEWDDRCLQFYKNKRTVNTASYDQVNQPIYQQSMERWRHYEKHLKPLKIAIGNPDNP